MPLHRLPLRLHTLNGHLPLRVIEHTVYTPASELRRLAPAVLSACNAWSLRCLKPAARGAWRAGGACRLRRLATVVLGTIVYFGWPLEASRGPDEPAAIRIFGMFQECLGTLDASKLLQYAIHSLFGLASRGLQRPPEAQMSPNQYFRDVPRVLRS